MRIEGFRTGTPRTWGRLGLWPLYAPPEDVGFVDDIHLADDRSYGSMGFTTEHPGGGIGPWGYMVFFVSGQDRALRESIYIRTGETVYAQTVCVEPAQAGTWHGQELDKAMLPPSLLASLPAGGGYSALWESIEARTASVGKVGNTVAGLLDGHRGKGRGYELPGDARGALVTLDGRPIAVEIAPNPGAFESWWQDFGLADSMVFESRTLPDLPLPLGPMEEVLRAGEDGMRKASFMDILKGWMYVRGGKIVYASLVDGEALLTFHNRKKREEHPTDEFECD